jgi:hypothetical protein
MRESRRKYLHFSNIKNRASRKISSGIVELIASILILFPRTTFLGALLALDTIIGAIISYLFVLEIEVNNDGGLLFILASIMFACSLYLILINKIKISD